MAGSTDAIRQQQQSEGGAMTQAGPPDGPGPLTAAQGAAAAGTGRLSAALAEAAAGLQYVRVARNIIGADVVDGHVVALGAAWVVLRVLHAGAPNGWIVVPSRDVASVAPAPGGRFVRRRLEAQDRWPPQPPQPPLELDGDIAALVCSAGAGGVLLTLYTERDDPSSCSIGRLVDSHGAGVRWHQLSPSAHWEEAAAVPLVAITRVDFGGQYEAALLRLSQLRTPDHLRTAGATARATRSGEPSPRDSSAPSA